MNENKHIVRFLKIKNPPSLEEAKKQYGARKDNFGKWFVVLIEELHAGNLDFWFYYHIFGTEEYSNGHYGYAVGNKNEESKAIGSGHYHRGTGTLESAWINVTTN